jgi:hypothetical protein
VLSGTGDGSFLAAADYPVGRYPYSVAVGDFNGDGILDLAVGRTGGGGVQVLLGNGDGTFQTSPTSYGAGASSVAVADFNSDGLLDLAVANPDTGSISILLNDGNWP